jgi:hypothetical protein
VMIRRFGGYYLAIKGQGQLHMQSPYLIATSHILPNTFRDVKISYLLKCESVSLDGMTTWSRAGLSDKKN